MGIARAAVLGVALLATGCVERELRVESDPPGADVYLNGKRVGTTPHKEAFTFYGARRITLRLDGHAVQERIVPINPPWYQIIPLDLFFEHVWPGDLKDQRVEAFALEPMVEANPDELIGRAKEFRTRAETAPPPPK